MDNAILTALLVSGVLRVIVVSKPNLPGAGKHIYVNYRKIWMDAQQYCQQHYTDLSSVGSVWEETQLNMAAGGRIEVLTWFGMHRDPTNLTGWKWSGGGYTTYIGTWGWDQPSNGVGNVVVAIAWNLWYDMSPLNTCPFFCVQLIVVTESKTWEGALEYCREQHTDLASLLSATELLQAQAESTEAQTTTSYLWTGLVYLADSWLWVNGDPLEYEGWPQGGAHLCPAWNLRCGAIGLTGLWENRDCQERLSFICY
uniref:C-type lectin domain-containing protein n=1 Tax=Esox lucius TaxID=8010 RepID=A0A3P8XUQ6_ESOLU